MGDVFNSSTVKHAAVGDCGLGKKLPLENKFKLADDGLNPPGTCTLELRHIGGSSCERFQLRFPCCGRYWTQAVRGSPWFRIFTVIIGKRSGVW